MKLMLFVLLCAVLLWKGTAAAEAAVLLPGQEQRADYWLSRLQDGDRVLLTQREIDRLNKKMGGVDFADYPAALSRAELTQEIESEQSEFPYREIYVRKGELSLADYQQVMDNCNLNAVKASNPVRWAVTVCRTNLRELPSLEQWMDVPDNDWMDFLQATALDPGEPLAVLHESADGAMLCVESRNYRGWVCKKDVAMCTQAQAVSYARPKDFLVVTGNRIRVGGELYQLGARLPLEKSKGRKWLVRVPRADRNGNLQEETVAVAESEKLHRGWLPCTHANLLRMAFTCLGDDYDWGGMTDSVDCSSFVGDAYRTLGIELPRNADMQEKAAPLLKVIGDDDDPGEALSQAQPGDLLFRVGHVMMYLGEGESGPAIIHAFSQCSEDGVPLAVRRVGVTKADYTLKGGQSNLDCLTGIGRYF